MCAMDKHRWFSILSLFLITILSYSSGQQQEGCQYRIKTQTADIKNAGLASGKVRISLCGNGNDCFLVLPDLVQYGDRGPRYEYYFEKGRYSYFTVRTVASCSPTCRIVLGHDGSGKRADWLPDFVEVEALTTWGSSLFNNLFPIYGWVNRSQQVTVNRCLQDDRCNYEIWVRTGDVHNATTNGKVRLSLKRGDESVIDVEDLGRYGVKGPYAADYFNQRSHSLFIIPTVSEKCSNPCKASLSHSGDDSWFLETLIVNIYSGTNFQYKEPFNFHRWIVGDQIATVDHCKLGQLRAIA